MKMHYTAPRELARRTVSDAQITGAYLLLGTVMVTMIAVMVRMSPQNTVEAKEEHALEICLLAIMEIVCRVFTFAMGIMIAWITVTKTIDISVVSVKLYYISLDVF